MIPSSVTGLPRLGTAHGSLLHSGPRPRLVWAGDVDGAPERLELSGRVSATWANKVANLLVEEINAGPGSRVLLDLPRHWRTLAWSLGTWLTGASVLLADSADPTDSEMPDVVVTRSLETAELAVTRGAELVVLVPLASFALRVPGGTPAGVLDGSADVAAQPDDLGPVHRPSPRPRHWRPRHWRSRHSGPPGRAGRTPTCSARRRSPPTPGGPPGRSPSGPPARMSTSPGHPRCRPAGNVAIRRARSILGSAPTRPRSEAWRHR
ncbi:TIGR03089 family protein [Salana multivorans]